MTKILSLSIAVFALGLSACSGLPDTCDREDIDLDCGVGAYSEERTVEYTRPEAPAPIVAETVVVEEPTPAPTPVTEPETMPEPEPAPVPVMEPVQSKADDTFREQLTK